MIYGPKHIERAVEYGARKALKLISEPDADGMVYEADTEELVTMDVPRLARELMLAWARGERNGPLPEV